ncbi:MAG: DUF3800 domain-containing protein [Candidatus Dormibacteraeota bacterium]|nr:DUF3800 domain-containing protein [Candidatus Dormibacteraeota bacterium]
MLQVFVDDSGDKGDQSPAVLAGLLQTAQEWAAFTRAWQATLAGEPRIERFKMSEAATLTDAFRGVSLQARDSKLRALAAVVRLHAPTVFRSSIDLDAFAETLAPKQTPPHNQPYFHLFYGMIWRVAVQLALCHHTEPFEIIFDRKVTHEQMVTIWYPLFCEHVERLAKAQGPTSIWAGAKRVLPAKPIFRSDDQSMPLQAADLYAWLLRNEMMGRRSEFMWLRDHLPSVTSASDQGRDYWRTLVSPPTPERADLIRRLSDPDRYAELLGLNQPIGSLPRVLKPRAKAFRNYQKAKGKIL